MVAVLPRFDTLASDQSSFRLRWRPPRFMTLISDHSRCSLPWRPAHYRGVALYPRFMTLLSDHSRCSLPWRPAHYRGVALYPCSSSRCSLSSEYTTNSPGNGNRNSVHLHFLEATRFIDEHVIDAVKAKDGKIRQIVLLTDGVDLRPYRLPWPPASLIFHVSSCSSFQPEKTGLPKLCLLRHMSGLSGDISDLEEWTKRFSSVGYQGDRPSVWVIQGLESLDTSRLHKILANVSSLAMKGSILVGEVPVTAISCTNKVACELEKIFLTHGFSIKSSVNVEPSTNAQLVLFVAEQLRLSDEQVRKVMMEIELAEDAGDEETFEDW